MYLQIPSHQLKPTSLHLEDRPGYLGLTTASDIPLQRQ